MAAITSFTLTTHTPTLVAARRSRSQRQWVRIQNDGPGDVRIGIGVSAITSSKGDILGEGIGCYISNEDHASPATEAIYAIGRTDAAVIHVTEGGSK